MAVTKSNGVITIPAIEERTIVVAVKGTRPLILNRMTEKARQDLLLPKGRKNTAEKAATLKHNPIEEFRASPYLIREENGPTLLAIVSAAFKKAMMSAAKDVPGVYGTEIARRVWVEGDLVPVYGIPEVLMAVTRSAGISKAPDVRTRVIVPQWCAILPVTYNPIFLSDQSIVNLLTRAGRFCGVGDWRPEKGSGTYGQFTLTDAEQDEEFQTIMANGGRSAQQQAMDNPVAYDAETEELFSWFITEAKLRGKTV